jgi:hypothetical protein
MGRLPFRDAHKNALAISVAACCTFRYEAAQYCVLRWGSDFLLRYR